MSTPLAETVRATVTAFCMLPPGCPALVMVSGGGDSVALLRLLASGDVGESVRLTALHVDHMLRGADSEADARFVEELCEGLGVGCRVARFDVGGFAEEAGLNLEDAGRRVRYRFAQEELDALLDAAGVPRDDGRILTAHTRDDLVETFLMRATAGAGAGGLAGIPPVRGRVVRPLIGAAREEVRAYLRDAGAEWREDPTNAEVERVRARLRRDIVPVLREINPRFEEAFARTARILAEEDALLDALAADLRASATLPEDDTVLTLDRQSLAAAPPALARRALRLGIAEVFPEATRIDAVHVQAVIDGLGDEAHVRDIGEGLRASVTSDAVVVARIDERPPTLEPSLLEVPGELDLGPGGRLVAEEVAGGSVSKHPCVASIDAASVTPPLTVGGPREGERLRPLGMEGTKTVSDLLSESGVPARRRARVPVVRDGEDVVWVAGVRVSDAHKVRPETERMLRLTWHGE